MTEPNFKHLSRGVSRDMSPEAIARRLEIASQLHELSKMLGRSKRRGKIEPETDEGPSVVGEE